MAPSAHGPSYFDAQSSLWADTPPAWMSLNGKGLTCIITRAAIGRSEYGVEDHYIRSKTTYIGLPPSHLTLALFYVWVRTTMQGKNPLPMKTVSPPLSYHFKQTSPLTPPFPYSTKTCTEVVYRHPHLFNRTTHLRLRRPHSLPLIPSLTSNPSPD